MGWREWVWKRLTDSWKHQGIQRAVVFCGIAVVSISMFWTLYIRLRDKTQEWHDARTPELDEGKLVEWCVAAHPKQEILCNRLGEQAATAEARMNFHFDLFGHYVSEHFAAISLAFWAGIMTAACLAYLVKKGWEHAHDVMSTAFVAFSICVAFYGGYPALAKHEDNITDNEFLYLEHQNLLSEIRTFCVTGEHKAPTSSNPVMGFLTDIDEHEHKHEVMEFEDYVHHVDARLRTLNRIPLEFDASQIDIGSTKFLETQAEVP